MIQKNTKWIGLFVLLILISISSLFSQITMTGLSNINWTEGSSQPVIFGSNASVTGGGSYGGGYLLFDLENGDQLNFTSSITPNASGAISYSGSNIYLGNGTGNEIIGNIDPILDGQNGNDLKINFTGEFANSSFESGLTGWTVGQQMVDLGVTQIAGFTTPDDNTYPTKAGGDSDVPSSSSYSYELSTSQYTQGTSSLRLYSSMTTASGYDVVHGPYVYSAPFNSNANDVISFDWRAYAGSDAYDVFGYILNINTGATKIILDVTGNSTGASTSWATASVVIPATGTYRFVFVSGTYDYSGGRAAGASLYIDNVRVFGDLVNDLVVENILKTISYENNCGNSPATRNLTVTAVNRSNISGTTQPSITFNTFAPVALCKSNHTLVLDSAGLATLNPIDLDSNSTDYCSITLEASQTNFNCDDIGNNNITLNVYDSYGNMSSCSSMVKVKNNILPQITCVPDKTIRLNNGESTYTVPPPPSLTQVYDIKLAQLVGLTYTCSQGTKYMNNFKSVGFDWTDIGTTPVENIKISLPVGADCNPTQITYTTEINGVSGTSFLSTPRWCSCTPQATRSIVVLDNYPTSGYNLGGTNSFRVNIGRYNWGLFPEPSLNTSYAQVEVNYKDPGSDFDPKIFVNCAKSITYTLSGATTGTGSNTLVGTILNPGTTYIDWVVEDNQGRKVTCSQKITIIETTPPTVITKSISLPLDSNGLASITPNDIDNGSYDNIGIQSYSIDKTSFNCSDIGPQTVTLTITDVNGLVDSGTAIVTVEDNIAPILSCKADTAILDANGNVTITYNDVLGSVYENCSGVSYTLSNNAFTTNNIGTNYVVLTAIDGSGNSSTCTATVLVVEPAPVAICKNATLYLDANGHATLDVDDVDDGSYSLVGLSSRTVSQSAFDCSGVGTNNVWLTVTNSFNKSDSCMATVIVYDNVVPIANTKNITVQLDANGQVSITPQDIDNNSTDNCSIASYSLDQTSFDCSHVGVNTVSLTVEDVNSNSSTATATVTVEDNIAPVFTFVPADITITADRTDCEPIVTWAAPTASDNCGVTITSNYSSGDRFPVGTTNVVYTVTDPSNNQSTANFNVTVNPKPVLVSYTTSNYNGNNISCNGFNDGSIDVTVEGGCLPYTYAWGNNATSEDISGLGAGTYTLTVTDANNTNVTITVTLTEPAPLATSISSYQYAGGWNISCYGEDDGNADLTVTGGTTVYAYAWSNSGTTEDIQDLAVGTYSVTVTDANGCVITDQITLTEPDELQSTVASPTFIGGNNISCYGEDDGSIDLTVVGGTTAYAYAWSNAATTEDIFDLVAGSYSVTVTDANGCQTSSSITLTEPTELTASITSPTFIGGNNISCYGEDDGTANLTAQGGIAPYVYAWSNNETTEDIADQYAGYYSVLITDVNGCTATADITLTEPAELVADAGIDTAMCLNASKTLGGTSVGGIASYTYAWAPTTNMTGSTSANPVVTPVVGIHTYIVTVTDQNGCVDTDDATVTVYELPVASIDTSSVDLFCNGITLTANSSTTENLFSWNNGEDTKNIYLSINNDTAGTYSVIVTDQNGCVSIESADYGYTPETNIGSYTILGVKDVRLGHYHNVANGSVGVTDPQGYASFGHKTTVMGTGSFVKAKRVYKHNTTDINEIINEPASATMPERLYNTSYNSSFSWKKVSKGQSDSITDDYISVKVEQGATAILTGQYFGEIKVEKGGKVVFYSPDVEIEELEVKGSKPGFYYEYYIAYYEKGKETHCYKAKKKVYYGKSEVVFMSDATVKVAKEIDIDRYTTVNPGYYKVVFYVGTENLQQQGNKNGKNCNNNHHFTSHYGSKYHKGDVKIEADNVEFNGSIYMPEGEMKVSGGYKDYSYFTGSYIVYRMMAEGKNVQWNWYSCDTFYNGPMMKYAVSEEMTSEIINQGQFFMEVYPNPFSSVSNLEFGIKNDGRATIEMYDIMGKKVDVLFDGNVEKDFTYRTEVQGNDLKNGVYLIRLVNGDDVMTKRIVLSR